YTTGEVAERCGTTIRAVQFYDKKGIVHPDAFSEGGRRLYSEENLRQMQIVCLCRQLEMPLKEIKAMLSDGGTCWKRLSAALRERERCLKQEIAGKIALRNTIRLVRTRLSEHRTMEDEPFCGIQKVITEQQERRRRRTLYAQLTAAGLLLDGVQALLLGLWLFRGSWMPFAAGMPAVAAILGSLTRFYYRSVQYDCSSCGRRFKPTMRRWFFAMHTPTARKLTCTHCGFRGWHTEAASD
ncbi:MAG: MerR family transcriptional regulator, partial [Treponemataceae bacterium]|nr:MerR family transcriptional regulator [Treponemataceae bacterium]